MKIRQTIRHFAAKKALETPVVGGVVNDRLVDLHTNVFLDKADEDRAEERREHLSGFFDATMDAYLAALNEGYTEAEAREITHIQANLDFYVHGWTEMMEFPVEEVDEHHDRYADFFERHGVTVEDPLGEFGEAPDAPATPERLDDPDHPHAVEGYGDDVYVEDEQGEVARGGRDEPDDVDVSDAPGVADGGEDAEEDRDG